MDPVPSSSPRFFQPLTLVLGVVAGLALLSWGGRAVNDHDWHRDFVRFHPMMAPESNYQPTIDEMRAIVRAHCRANQILVVVGGNSIFQGVGQPVDQIWTKRLQELLGERYAVVNLAFRGSSPTDAGALVAESLRTEFPRQIYVANLAPLQTSDPAGGLDYRFMMLDAWYKDRVIDYPARRAQIADYLSRPDVYPGVCELNAGARLDAWLHFRDFWNWWGYTRFFTLPNPLRADPAQTYRARQTFADAEPDFDAMPFRDRFADRFRENEMKIVRGTTELAYERVEGVWQLKPERRKEFRDGAAVAFPDPVKARTLLVLSLHSPYYTNQLSPDERARDAQGFADSAGIWRDAGYGVTDYGPGFTQDDFGDRTHLTKGGGRKLAERLAPEIRQLAARLGFASPSAP